MGNPDKERFAGLGRESRAIHVRMILRQSQRIEVVCEGLLRENRDARGGYGSGDANFQLARDVDQRTPFAKPSPSSPRLSRSRERSVAGEAAFLRHGRGSEEGARRDTDLRGGSARYCAALILEIQLEITRMDEPVSGRRTGLKAC